MTPWIQKLGTIVLLLAGIVVAAAIRMRCSRDRRRIGAELAKRRFRMVAVRVIPSRFRPLGAAAYEVDLTDDEDDPAQTTCTVRRGIITWADSFADIVPTPETLPTYGQNWRG